MSEVYWPETDDAITFSYNTLLAQTFMPLWSHTCDHIRVKPGFMLPHHILEISIQYLKPDGTPTGTRLTWIIIDFMEACGVGAYNTFQKACAPIRLVVGIHYALVFQQLIPIWPTLAQTLYKPPPSTYPRGKLIRSTDGGSTWDTTDLGDMVFAEWGDPPIPPNPWVTPIDHWAAVTLGTLNYSTSACIRISTSSPVYAVCHVTKKPPGPIYRWRTIRGVRRRCFDNYAFVEMRSYPQLEKWDSIYHTFHIKKLNPPAIIPDAWDITKLPGPPHWETWGDTLTQNNPWTQRFPAHPIQYALWGGNIRIFDPATTGAGIRCEFTPSQYPLLIDKTRPFMFAARTHYAVIRDPHDWASVQLWTTKGDEGFLLDLVFARGTFWGEFGTLKEASEGKAVIDYGREPIPFNILEFWQWARQELHESTDPTGWSIKYITMQLEYITEIPQLTLTNSFIHIYYPPPLTIPVERGTYWFTFTAESDFALSTSIAPLVKRVHPGGPPFTTIRRPNAPGDLCTIPREVGDPCPNHYLNIDEAIPDEDETLILGRANGSAWWTDLYYIPGFDLSITQPIAEIHLTGRFKRTGGYAYAARLRLALKTHGVIYYSDAPSEWGENWQNLHWHVKLNPETNLPWTPKEVNSLQIGVRIGSYRGIGWWTITQCTQLYCQIIHDCSAYE